MTGNPERELIVALGSQGTAALAILSKLLRAFIAKGLLREIEAVAILDAAAEAAEAVPDAMQGEYSRATGAAIRTMMEAIQGAASPPAKH